MNSQRFLQVLMENCKRKLQLVILSILLATSHCERRVLNDVTDPPRIACAGVIFNDVYFERETLFPNINKPYNLVMHKFSGILFFSHNIISKDGDVNFGIKACHIQKRKCIDVKGIPGGYAVAYDAGNDDIFMGGEDGIYKYNFVTKSADFFAEDGYNVWGILVKSNFYYIKYPSQKLHILEDETFTPVQEAVNIEIDHFLISKSRDVYYVNKTAVFKVPKPASGAPIMLTDDLRVRQITEDAYGDFYICASDGIYIEDKPYQRVKKVADVDQVFGLTFDENDRIIYSDIEGIYRLLPSKNNAVCYEGIKKHKWREEARRKAARRRFLMQKALEKKIRKSMKARKKMG